MAKTQIRHDEHFDKVMGGLTSRGLLLVSCDKAGKPNAMTIGWGLTGSVWGLPLWVVLVRPSRYTDGLINQTQDFTVNVPGTDLAEACAHCGEGRQRKCHSLIPQNLIQSFHLGRHYAYASSLLKRMTTHDRLTHLWSRLTNAADQIHHR